MTKAIWKKKMNTEVVKFMKGLGFSLEPCHDGNCDKQGEPGHEGYFVMWDWDEHGSDMFIPYKVAEEMYKEERKKCK